MRFLIIFATAMLGVVLDLALNLLAAAIQQRAIGDVFSTLQIGWLVGFALAGLLLGVWLSAQVELTPQPSRSTRRTTRQTNETLTAPPAPLTMTRLQALFSLAELKGQGIYLSDILLIGSRLKIETNK